MFTRQEESMLHVLNSFCKRIYYGNIVSQQNTMQSRLYFEIRQKLIVMLRQINFKI